jgi:hypothetical protein
MNREAKNAEWTGGAVGPRQAYHTRQTRFTPENIRQITNLVERGKTKEEIAEVIGVTVGTLQVTCSKLGISLRQPRFDTGTGMLPRRRIRPDEQPFLAVQSHSTIVAQDDKNEQHQSLPEEAAPKQAELPHRRRGRETEGDASVNFAITMRYKGQQKTSELPLTKEMIGHLALEAEFRGVGIGELMTQLIVAAIAKDMFRAMLDENSGAEILDLRSIRQNEPQH